MATLEAAIQRPDLVALGHRLRAGDGEFGIWFHQKMVLMAVLETAIQIRGQR
jgi:hypothetical protein